MKLTEDMQKKAIEFVEDKWKDPSGRPTNKCQVCHTSNWSVHPNLYELRTFNQGGFVVGGPVVPLLVLECQNCGNTIMLSAIKAGLVESLKQEDSK